MRSTVRSLTFSLAGLLSAGAMAQYPYTIALSGTVTNCYPGQVVTVQITAHLDLPSSMGPLGDLFEVLDAVAFGRRFDE